MISIVNIDKWNTPPQVHNTRVTFIKKNIFLPLLFCFSIFTSAWGQSEFPSAFHIFSDTAAYVILPDSNWQVMADSTGKLNLQQVINSNFFHHHNRKINYKIHVYWQRYRLTNRMMKEVKIATPETSAYADLFIKTDDEKWQHQKTGSLVPWSMRDGLKRIPAFTFSIPPGETLTIYKRVYWDYVALQPDTMRAYFNFTDKLIEDRYVNDEFHDMTAIQDIFLLGMFILSIIINFYFFIIVREKEFLYFSLLLLLYSVMALCSLNDVFLKENPQLLNYLYLITNSFAGFVFIQFVRYFLKTFQRFPRWDTCLLLFSFIQVGIIFFAGIASAVFQTNLAILQHASENVIKLTNGIFILITLFLYVRNKDRMIRLMLIALIPVVCLKVAAYAIALIYGIYSARFGSQDVSGYKLEFNSVAFFILIVCYLWMMVIFTWVLFLRFSNVRKELAHQASLDHLKSRFFANISHEFRTPLTLIIGPIEDLLQDKNAQKFKEPLQYIHRNSKRLLQLINQLLDLSRLDVGNYQVNTTREDIIPFVKQIVHSFSSMAHRNNILLDIEVDPRLKNDLRNETSFFYFDEDIIEKIITNLLGNAFKFTAEDGSIIVSICLAEKDLLELKVEDSGTGIPSEKLPYIFDRFYQADDSHKKQYAGTGIGLALVKELVQLHQGKIKVISVVNKGTAFSCYFSFNKKILSKKSRPAVTRHQNTTTLIEENANIAMEESTIGNKAFNILVVEDQQDVRKYIRSKLAGIYTVAEAKNGREGYDMARQQIPDLVISDVMMPEMDGFELCKLLKTDDLTSHIPVILLTARAEDSDKLSGLQTGADAYLIKPFNSKELLVRVHNLIDLRNKLRKKFSGKLIVKPSEITVTPQDSQFMQRLLETVETHISDEQFSVEQLGHEFGMSPSQINRKLKAIINQSALTFIRSVRMQRALELLKNDKATIAEIAYETGFKEPSYFSKVFKDHFGYSPSEVKK